RRLGGRVPAFRGEGGGATPRGRPRKSVHGRGRERRQRWKRLLRYLAEGCLRRARIRSWERGGRIRSDGRSGDWQGLEQERMDGIRAAAQPWRSEPPAADWRAAGKRIRLFTTGM